MIPITSSKKLSLLPNSATFNHENAQAVPGHLVVNLVRNFVTAAALALSFAFLVAVPAPSEAALLADAWAYCENGTSIFGRCPTYQVTQTYSDSTYPGPGAPTAYVNNADQRVLAEAYAYADYGVLKVSGHAEAAGTVPNTVKNLGDANSRALWADSLTINSAGYDRFTPAILTALFAVSGGYSRNGGFSIDPGAFDTYTAGTQGNWSVSIWNNYYNGSESGTLYQTGYDNILRQVTLDGVTNNSAPDIFGLYTVQVPIQLGERFDIKMEISGRAYALAYGAGASSSSGYDLGRSAYWGGIGSITVDGQEIPFTLTSQSGHDWTQSSIPAAVPVPTAAWLFGPGLLGLVGVARRRARENK